MKFSLGFVILSFSVTERTHDLFQSIPKGIAWADLGNVELAHMDCIFSEISAGIGLA